MLLRTFSIEEKMFVFLAKCTKVHSIPLSTLSTWKERVRMQKKREVDTKYCSAPLVVHHIMQMCRIGLPNDEHHSYYRLFVWKKMFLLLRLTGNDISARRGHLVFGCQKENILSSFHVTTCLRLFAPHTLSLGRTTQDNTWETSENSKYHEHWTHIVRALEFVKDITNVNI